MTIGVICERRTSERRVGMTPASVANLVLQGHEVIVESGAGTMARFGDDEYLAAGARVVYDREEVFGRSELLVKVAAPRPDEVAFLHEGQVVLAFHHMAAASPEMVKQLLATRATLIGYEVVEDSTGGLPVLHAMSEIAGQLAVQAAARSLETTAGGRGILLGGATGIPPASVAVLGAGVAGLWAAKTAAGNRAQVTVLDTSLAALRRVAELLGGLVITEVAHPRAVARAAAFADVLIGAVLIRGGERAPHVVDRRMVESMKPGSVIVDLSIDQGGCVETSHPTTLEDPTYTIAGVTHYAVPNITSAVARTASLALSHAALPLVLALVGREVESTLRRDPAIAAGVYVHRGALVSESVGRAFGMKQTSLGERIGEAVESAKEAR